MRLGTVSAFALSAMLVLSCDSDSENNNHSIGIIRPDGVAYADQQSDTLAVSSTDSWTAGVEEDGVSGLWFAPTEFSRNVGPNRVDYSEFPITFQPNTNDSIRKSYFVVRSNGKTLRRTFVQVPWMNILSPGMVVRRKDGTVTSLYDTEHLYELQAYFYFEIVAGGGNSNIKLNLHAPSAVVSTADEWLSIKDDDGRYVKSIDIDKPVRMPYAEITIPVSSAPNTDSGKREGNVVIATSNGVVQTISFIQEGAKKN